MKRIFKLFVCLILITFSCDFLDEEPLVDPVAENFYANLNEVQLGVNAIYEILTSSAFQRSYALIGSGRGDNMVAIDDEKFSEDALLFNFTAGSLHPTVVAFWQANYRGIYRANQLIEGAKTLRTLNANNLVDSEGDLRVMIGEAKFLRAFYYFNLVRTYGGVPIKPAVLTLTGEDDNFSQPRSSAQEVYEYIEKDLREAIIALNYRDLLVDDRTQIGKIEELAAWSFLLKVLVYQAEPGVPSNKWEQAKAVGEHLVDGTRSEWFHEEILNYDELYANDPTEIIRLKQELVFDTLTEDQFLNRTAGLGIGRPTLSFPYAYLTREIADLSPDNIFQVNHVVLPDGSLTLNSPFHSNIGSANLLQPTGSFSNDFSSDPRVKFSIINAGETLADDSTNPNPPFPEKTGCYKWKTWAGENANVKNFIIMRYAEVLLYYAEALNEVGLADQAIDQLNKIRARAREIANYDPRVVSLSDPADYGLSNYLETRRRVWLERRLELCFEFDRWWEIVRTGQSADAFTLFNSDVQLEYRKRYIRGVSELLPIPLVEIDASGGVVLQNPGY